MLRSPSLSGSGAEEKQRTDHFFVIPRLNQLPVKSAKEQKSDSLSHEEDVINRKLPEWLDEFEQLADFLSHGVPEQFIPPVFFTDTSPEYFESAESKEMKYWNKAMCSGLGGQVTLDERCLLEIRGVPVGQSSFSEIRKVNRILGYPHTQRWIDHHEPVHNEIVMSECLLSKDQYRMAVYSLPFIQRDHTVDLLIAFFKDTGDHRAGNWVRLHAQSVKSDIDSFSVKKRAKQANPVFNLFKTLYPSGFKLFNLGASAASEKMEAFQAFCKKEQDQAEKRDWELMIGQVRCLLKTLFSRGCEPLEITRLNQTLLAQALYVTLHMTGNADRVIFQDEMAACYYLTEALEKHSSDDPALYALEENEDLNHAPAKSVHCSTRLSKY